MYPTLYHAVLDLFGLDIPLLGYCYSYGFFVGLAFLLAVLLFRSEFKRGLRSGAWGVPKDNGAQTLPVYHIALLCAIWGAIGGMIFAWLEEPALFLRLLHAPLSPSSFPGFTVYGTLIIGGLAVVRYALRHGLPLFILLDALAPSWMLAYSIGRLGCHVSGDGDWGVPVKGAPPHWLPDGLWFYDYPNNIINAGIPMVAGPRFLGYGRHLDPPVYPTPIYESITCFVLFLVLWRLRRNPGPHGSLFCLYMVLVATERFVVEFIRATPVSALGLSQAQWISLGLLVVSAGIYVRIQHPSQA